MTHPIPAGFYLDGIRAGIKSKGPDLGFIYSDEPCQAAGVFTRNQAKAAPVQLSEKLLGDHQLQGVVVNAGNANAATGTQGIADAQQMQLAFATRAGLQPSSVGIASTGAIGQRLPTQKVIDGIALFDMTRRSIEQFQQAILTTDTKEKIVSETIETAAGNYTILGIAKGSGMIHPNMGTMLGFLMTDAYVPGERLQEFLTQATDASFNQVTVDGDTSTNDSVFVLANGKSNVQIEDKSEETAFYEALERLMIRLAKKIAEDGEGATRLVEVRVSQAATVEAAREAAKKVVGSSLVKAAIYGHDPNWGRVISSLGMSANPVDLDRLSIKLNGTIVFDQGDPQAVDKQELKQSFENKQIQILIDLRVGQAEGVAWGCDLTEEYVRLNADYHT